MDLARYETYSGDDSEIQPDQLLYIYCVAVPLTG